MMTAAAQAAATAKTDSNFIFFPPRFLDLAGLQRTAPVAARWHYRRIAGNCPANGK
jgi:hypothetical protein